MSTQVVSYRKRPSAFIDVRRANRGGCTGTFANPHSAGLSPCPECSRFKLKKIHTPAEATDLFRVWMLLKVATESEFRSGLIRLRDRVLVCGCPQKKECEAGLCNGKVIASFLDSLPEIVTEEELVAAARADLARLAAAAVEEAER